MKLATIGRMLVVSTLLGAMAAGCSEDNVKADVRAPKPKSLYDRLRRASVEILIDGRMAGSGCLVDPEGVVLTACHVLKNSKNKRIEVISPAIGRVIAKQIATDRGHDLALLSIPRRKEKYPHLKVADRMPDGLSKVLLPSSPIWRHGLVLTGSIARIEPSYCWQSTLKCYIRCVYIDGASPVGSSGGCWTDSSGQVVAVQSGYLNNTDKSWVGIAFAAPVDAIRELMARRGDRKAATLGAALEELWTQSPGFIARLPKGAQGVVTPRVDKGGPLDQAGMTRETLIMEIDGSSVAYLDELLEIIRAKKPGDEVTLKVIEPIGKPARKVKIKLAEVK